jgi:hypothetical protein
MVVRVLLGGDGLPHRSPAPLLLIVVTLVLGFFAARQKTSMLTRRPS